MRKFFGVLVAFLFLSVLVPQPSSATTIDLGLKGGFSFSNMTWKDGGPSDGGSKWLMKPAFGAFLAFNLNPMFSLQPEVYLWRAGLYDEEEGEGETLRYELVLSYIHMPILAKVHLVKEGKLRPILFAGPSVSFLSKAVNRIYINGALEDEGDVKEFLKSTDFGAVIGGGIEFNLDKLLLVLDVRYNLGLANVNNKGEATGKNKALMILAGIGF